MATVIQGLELIDHHVEVYIDEYGANRERDSEQVRTRSAEIINELEGTLGTAETERREVTRGGRGTSYDGLDTIIQTVNHAWPVIASPSARGSSKPITELITEWSSLKKSREVVLKTRDGKEIKMTALGGREQKYLLELWQAEERSEPETALPKAEPGEVESAGRGGPGGQHPVPVPPRPVEVRQDDEAGRETDGGNGDEPALEGEADRKSLP